MKLLLITICIILGMFTKSNAQTKPVTETVIVFKEIMRPWTDKNNIIFSFFSDTAVGNNFHTPTIQRLKKYGQSDDYTYINILIDSICMNLLTEYIATFGAVIPSEDIIYFKGDWYYPSEMTIYIGSIDGEVRRTISYFNLEELSDAISFYKHFIDWIENKNCFDQETMNMIIDDMEKYIERQKKLDKYQNE